MHSDPKHQSPPPIRRGFTLVEILVVIGILAVLMSILIPVIRQARKQANTVKCMNNQKQLVQASTMFSRDNNDLLPFTGWGDQAVIYWAYDASKPMTWTPADLEKGQIWRYLKDRRVFRCPEDAGPWPAGSITAVLGYCMNGAASGFGSNNNEGLSILRFHPDDVLFFELPSTNSNFNGANDATNYPSEGVAARHKHGTVVGHLDGRVSVMMAAEFNNFCQAAGPNILWCSPVDRDGGRAKGAGYGMRNPVPFAE